MFTLKISIEGDFWDCQIYMGRLYLWKMDGTLQIFNWDALVNSFDPPNSANRLTMKCAFSNGSYLYGKDLNLIFEDHEFKSLLSQKFSRISSREMSISENNLKEFIIGEQDNPFKELPTDTEISSKKLFGVTNSGLWQSTAHRSKNEINLVSSRPKKIWDCPILSIKANNFAQLALSAGEEGLFELNQNTKNLNESTLTAVAPSIYQVSPNHSQFSDWAYLSIYSSSSTNDSFMAFYEWENLPSQNLLPSAFPNDSFDARRKLSSVISEKEIFGKMEKGLSWGSGDKLYKAHDRSFSMTRFRNTLRKKDENEEYFYDKHEISLDAWKGEVLGGGTSFFGTIVECENALVVILSNKETYTIPGPVTKWRVYPRSINYENHLHVILENRIEIYSFNNDYFINQKEKEFGLMYSESKHNRIRRGR